MALLERDSFLVAFSGGVDSSVLAALAFRALGEKSIVVTGFSKNPVDRCYISSHKKEIRAIAQMLGLSVADKPSMSRSRQMR